MRANVIVGITAIVATCITCQRPRKEALVEQLNGRWEFLGFWENAELRQDTLVVYFPEVPISLDTTTSKPTGTLPKDTFAYDIVTDSGVRKITSVEGEGVIKTSPHPYFVTIAIDGDTGGYIKGYGRSTFHNRPLKVKLANGQIKVYRDAVTDELTADTLIGEAEGVIKLITSDTIQIVWDTNAASQYKRANAIP